MKTTVLITTLLLFLTLASAEGPGYSSWIEYYQDQGAEVEDLGNLLQITHNGEDIIIQTTLSQTSNNKNLDKYTDNTVFLVSDEDWRDVLTLLPVSIWVPSQEDMEVGADGQKCNLIFNNQGKDDFPYTSKCAYPLLIYHKEGNNYDVDSILHFLDQYGAKKVIHVGAPTEKLRGLLEDWEITETNTDQTFGYWKTANSVVFVEGNNYLLAMLAAQYAAYENTPLVIGGTSLNTEKVYLDKIVICIGSSNPAGATCDVRMTKEDLQRKIIYMTGTDKALILNPNDIKDEYCENMEFETQNGGKISKLYCHDSLAAAYLAAAKEELIVQLDLEPSYSIKDEPQAEDYVITQLVAYDNNMYALDNRYELISFDISNGVPSSEKKIDLSIDYMYLKDIQIEEDKLFLFYNHRDGTPRVAVYDLSAGDPFKEPFFEFTTQSIDLKDSWRMEVKTLDDVTFFYFSTTKNLYIFWGDEKTRRLEYLLPVYPIPGSNVDFGWIEDLEISEETLYVADQNRIFAYDIEDDGTLNSDWIFDGSQKNMIDSIDDLTVKDNLLYAADSNNKIILVFKIGLFSFGEKPIKLFGDFTNYENNPLLKEVPKDDSGDFYNPRLIETKGDYLYVYDESSHGIQTLSVKSDSGTHPHWTLVRGLTTKPEDLLLQIVESVDEEFSPSGKSGGLGLEIVSYLTYLASPMALQFSNTMPTSSASIDYLATELISLKRKSSMPLSHSERKEIDSKNNQDTTSRIKPYGRIFGVTVSDTSAYVSRSIFSKRIGQKYPETPLLRVLVGEEIAEPTYLETLQKKISGHYDYSCYVDENAIRRDKDAPLPVGCTSELNDDGEPITYEELEDTHILLAAVHGHPSGWDALSIFSNQILKHRFKPLVVVAYSCSNLDYYNAPESPHEPAIGLSFLRSGAMGYIGFVTPAADQYHGSPYYHQITTLVSEKTSLGNLMTKPPAGEEQKFDSYWSRNRKYFEPFFTLMGDPTYKSTFAGLTTPKGTADIIDSNCLCGYLDYRTETYIEGGETYCKLTDSSLSKLQEAVATEGESALLAIRYIDCLDYLDLRGFDLPNEMPDFIYGNVGSFKTLRYLDLRHAQITYSECTLVQHILEDAEVICGGVCDCSSNGYYAVLRDILCVLDSESQRRLEASIRLEPDSPTRGRASLEKISELHCLNLLSLRGVYELRDISPLSSLKSLRTLDLTHTQVSDITPLMEMYSLYLVGLSYTNVDPADCKKLEEELGKYNPNGVFITCGTLAECGCSHGEYSTAAGSGYCGLDEDSLFYMKSNIEFEPESPTRGAETMKTLSHVTCLSSLDISNTPITDVALEYVPKTIKSLDASNTGTSTISPLVGHPNLENVDLSFTQISEDDIPDIITMSLREVNLEGTQIPPSVCRELDSQMEKTNVICDTESETGDEVEPCGCSSSDYQTVGIPGFCALDSESKEKLKNTIKEQYEQHIPFPGSSEISEISDLTCLTSLDLSDIPVSDVGDFSKLINLNVLLLRNTDITDLSFLSELTNLGQLDLSNNEQITSFPILTNHKKLTDLNLGGTSVSDLSPLSELTNLNRLTVYPNIHDLSSFGVLENFKNLYYLDLSHNPQLSDMSHISKLHQLTSLYLSGTQVFGSLDKFNLEISNLINLRELGLSNCGVYGLWDSLSELNYLEHLDLSYNPKLSDISALSEATSLKTLNLQGTSISHIHPINELENLEELDLSYNERIRDFSLLSSFADYGKLRILSIHDTLLTDISFLKDIESLEELDLSHTFIADTEKHSNTAHLSKITNLKRLDLSYTFVSDLYPLRGLSNLKNLNLFGSWADPAECQELYEWLQFNYISTEFSNPPSVICPIEEIDYGDF